MAPKLLFKQTDIFQLAEGLKTRLKEQLRKAPESWFTSDATSLIDDAVARFSLHVPVLHREATEISHSEADIDVSRDPSRMIFDRSRPFYVKGARVTFHVPFTGDAGLFDVQPNSYTLHPPRASITSRELLFTYEATEDHMQSVHSLMEGELAAVETYLASLRPSAEQLDRELLQIAATEIANRRRLAEARKGVIDALPYKQRIEAPTSISRQPVTNREPSQLNSEQSGSWDVFISHAWEDKETVAAPLAVAFMRQNVRVWYDTAVLTVGDSLSRKIDEGLASQDLAWSCSAKASLTNIGLSKN